MEQSKRRKLTVNSLYETFRTSDWEYPSKPFSLQTGGMRDRSIQIVTNALRFVGGGESVDLVAEQVLSKVAALKPAYERVKRKGEEKYEAVMDTLAEEYNNQPMFKKRKVLSYVAHSHTHQELKKAGFSVHKNTYNAYLREGITEHKPYDGCQLPLRAQIPSFLDEHSRPSAYRSFKGASVRYLEQPLPALHSRFCEEWGQISYTAFNSSVPGHFKKPRADTDLCNICEDAKLAQQALDKQRNRLTAEEIEEYTRDMNFYNHHKQMNEKQRAAFKSHVAAVQQGTVLVVVDFKQDLIICKGKRQRGNEFYTPVHRSVLAFCLYYWNQTKNQVSQKSFIYLSEFVNKDSTHVYECFKKLMNLSWFKQQRFTNVQWWNDAGPHFRADKMAHFLLHHLTNKFNTVQWHFFVEHHGKSCVDVLFSNIARWYKERLTGDAVNSTEELQQFLQQKSNDAQSDNVFLIYTPSHQVMTQLTVPKLTIKNIKSFYCYHAERKAGADRRVKLHVEIAAFSGGRLRETQFKLGRTAAAERKTAQPIPTYNHVSTVSYAVIDRRSRHEQPLNLVIPANQQPPNQASQSGQRGNHFIPNIARINNQQLNSQINSRQINNQQINN
jgi:hypothetical protein